MDGAKCVFGVFLFFFLPRGGAGSLQANNGRFGFTIFIITLGLSKPP